MLYDLDPKCAIEHQDGFKFVNNLLKTRWKRYSENLICSITYYYGNIQPYLGRFSTGNAYVINIFVNISTNFPSKHYDTGSKKKYAIRNIDESLVYTFGHEFAHVLQHSKRLRLNETSATSFGIKLLKLFRKSISNSFECQEDYYHVD